MHRSGKHTYIEVCVCFVFGPVPIMGPNRVCFVCGPVPRVDPDRGATVRFHVWTQTVVQAGPVPRVDPDRCTYFLLLLNLCLGLAP